MPCGGIQPLAGILRKGDSKKAPCWMCRKGGCRHFCHEWDTWIHARCVPSFLQTDEGKVIIDHGHTVVLDFNLEVK